jgi:hypothetical protein
MGHALGFRLRRVAENDAFWRDLLGAPRSGHISVTVSLGERAVGDASSRSTILGASPESSSFQFEVLNMGRLLAGVVMAAMALAVVWGQARTSTALRDNLLPQLEASRQPYSLGRWQMAFWFTLIFAAFVVLFVLLRDANTITTQALYLMGISGATALAGVAIDVAKDSPADAANRGLRALGLDTYEDVRRVRQEIADRQSELVALSSTLPEAGPRRTQLQVEIQDRNNILRTYDDRIRPFVSQGWLKDITTDLNGTAIHRLQALCWTLALGVVFVIGLYCDLAMPGFNQTLLALMGISNAGYIGFKFPEVNS